MDDEPQVGEILELTDTTIRVKWIEWPARECEDSFSLDDPDVMYRPWVLCYYRYGGKYTTSYRTLQRARDSAIYGEDEGDLSAACIVQSPNVLSLDL